MSAGGGAERAPTPVEFLPLLNQAVESERGLSVSWSPKDVVNINLHNKGIEVADAEALKGLPSLRTLDLSFNQLTHCRGEANPGFL